MIEGEQVIELDGDALALALCDGEAVDDAENDSLLVIEGVALEVGVPLELGVILSVGVVLWLGESVALDDDDNVCVLDPDELPDGV